MANTKPESPLTIEEVLLLSGYKVHYADDAVCTLVPKEINKGRRAVCISKKDIGPHGLSPDIIDKILFDARIDAVEYASLLAKVQAQQASRQQAQTRNL
jgi:hypothetical protein